MTLICDKCSEVMRQDDRLTAMYYDKDISVIINKDGIIDNKVIPDYIIYSCFKCGAIKKISIKEIIETQQLFLIEHILKMRLNKSSEYTIRKALIEEHGIVYCGLCRGPFDGDGYCHKDWIDICFIRHQFNSQK